jgi:GLPGLI family protein
MKKHLQLILLLLLAHFSFSQSCGHVEYHIIINSNARHERKSTLYFNDTSTYFVRNKLGINETADNRVASEGQSVSLNLESSDEQGIVVYRNFNTKEIVAREAKMGKFFEAFTYQDNWIDITWDIKDDTLKIGSFTCQKAIGTFRGRAYTAWFTEQVPLPYGPWKLFGLPGLILQAEDQKGIFKMTMTSIEYPDNCTFSITKPTAPETKTLKEYVDFRDNFGDYLFKKIQARLPRNLANAMQQGSKNQDGRKYQDETVYEWEK